ncbi:Caleosin related protein-domain-containing protein [Zychaea mexicana]|uniref:Caleosin related protein-domain-containing protein n=1 Tax=Zychaea mexicana TaxID=64656 RepID=UPI0022FE4C35|nr:Caleosin related protein-domain-containing protein [Zychaea mexicana]KAI9477158.1 Caleosin related protein-domain-containing protein [Zychaea mexicana]
MAIIGVADPGGSRQRPTVARRRIVNVTSQENTAVRKHSKFWDRRNKGYITPVDTAAGLMNLGYGVIFSLTIGTFMGVFLAYATQDSWIPDPRCRINVRKLTRPTKRPSPSRVYDDYGQFDADKFETLFDKYAQSDLSGNTITLTELLQLASEQGSYGASPTAWTMAMFNWIGLYMMIGQSGSFHKTDIQAVYDGTLFYRIREARSAYVRPASLDTSTGHLLLPNNAVRAFERHLNSAVEHLPQSTVAIVRSWVPPVDSILSGNVVATPVRPRSRAFAKSERISGTKTVSFDNQAFSLTGVQGYAASSSSSSMTDDDLPDLISEESDSIDSVGDNIGVFTTGLCPEGADYYRDTPLTNWIGSQLSGVQKSMNDQNYIPKADINDKSKYGIPLAGVMNDGTVSSPLTDWVVEDVQSYDNDTDKKKAYMDTLQPVTLRGVVQSPTPAADHRIIDAPSYDHNKKVRFHLEPVTLSGVQHDDAVASGKASMHGSGVPIVDAPSPVEKDLNFDLEPVSLSGLRATDTPTSAQDDIVAQSDSTNKGLAIVQAPTTFEFQEVDIESYKQPVFLTGLSSAHKISDDHHGPLPIVDAPSSLLYKREKSSSSVHVESVALTGVSKMSTAADKDNGMTSAILMVKAPVSFETNEDVFESTISAISLTGISSSSSSLLDKTGTGFAPLSGLRSDSTPASFVKAPTNYERKRTVALEPMLLSGLRVSSDEPTGFVEAATSYAYQEPVSLEPIVLSGVSNDTTTARFVEESYMPKQPAVIERVSLSGLSNDTTTVNFVEEPAPHGPKKPAVLEHVKLSGLSNDTTTASFVEEPALYEAKQPVTLERVSLSGLSKDTTTASFVEAPISYTYQEPASLEPVALSGVSNDTTTASFVEEPYMPKQPAVIERVNFSGLSNDTTTANFVEEPAFYEPKQPVALERINLPGLSKDTTTASFVKEPASYEPKQPVALERANLSGLHYKDQIANVGFVELSDDVAFEKSYEPEPVSLSGLSQDPTTASFVEEPAFAEKAPADLVEAAKPVPLSGLSVYDSRYADYVEAPVNYKAIEVIKLEPAELFGLREEAETVWGPVEEPADYKAKESVPLEPATLSGLRGGDDLEQSWKLTGTGKRRLSFEEPLVDDEVDMLCSWRQNTGFEKNKLDVEFVYQWRDSMGFEGSIPPVERVELCGVVSSDEQEVFVAELPIVKDPYPSKNNIEWPFEATAISLSGLSSNHPAAKLKNHLNIGSIQGVFKQESSLYEDPIELPEEVQEHVDLQQYRRAFPLSGVHAKDMEERAIKNWLNNGALPGVVSNDNVYEAPGETLPKDYIEPRPKDDHDKVGVLASGISQKKIKKPLKNWLNVASLSGADAESFKTIYESAKPEPKPKEMEIDLEQYRAPFPLNGLTDDEVKHKNWLNSSILPGVQAASQSSYQDAASDIPSDYIQPRDPSLVDDKALNGISTATARNLRLKNWLSTPELPGVQVDENDRTYDEAKELSPSEYIQPPLEDQEMPADFKLTGVSSTDAVSEISLPELSRVSKLAHHDSEDEHSIATESTSPGPISPEEYKGKKPASAQKVAMTSANWSIMADITSQKEE